MVGFGCACGVADRAGQYLVGDHVCTACRARYWGSSDCRCAVVAAQQLAPRKLSGSERKEIQVFAEKVMAIAERVKAPLSVIAAGVARDVLLRRDSNLVRELIDESTALKTDFEALLQKYS